MIEKPKPFYQSFQFYCLCIGVIIFIFSSKDKILEKVQQERVSYAIKEQADYCANTILPPTPLDKFNIEEAYSAKALEQGKEGEISVKVNIDRNGNVISSNAEFTKENLIFVANSEEIAKKIIFRPALENCKPVLGDYTFNLKFMMY